jgi:hypothetical protein
MRYAGLSGIVRRRRGRTTVSAPGVRPRISSPATHPIAPDGCSRTALSAPVGGVAVPGVVMDCCGGRIGSWRSPTSFAQSLSTTPPQMTIARRRALFGGSILSKVTLKHPALPFEHVVAGGDDRAIHDDIAEMPMGIRHVGLGGWWRPVGWSAAAHVDRLRDREQAEDPAAR